MSEKQTEEGVSVDAEVSNRKWLAIQKVNGNPIIDGAKYFDTKKECMDYIEKFGDFPNIEWFMPRIFKGC
jgi:hypothetical protein